MNKLCICDLDGVIADNTARFAKAEEAKAAYLEHQDKVMAVPDMKYATNLYWETAFTPDLVQLDTLIDGVNEALLDVQQLGYRVFFLTSRPESMRDATEHWMVENTVFDSDDRLIMKPASAQYVKTVVWKSLTVEMLVRLFGVEDLLFIDDEPAIYESVAALALPCTCKVNASLQAALAML